MIIGKVVGKLWSTRKDEKLNGQKFLIVKTMRNKEEMDNSMLVCADSVGAGTGDLVLIVKGGSARVSVGDKEIPIDTAIVGIIDTIEVEDE